MVTMSSKQLGMLAAAGSSILLLAAFLFQSMGYAPCAMCLWQRYPHGVAIGAGLLLTSGVFPMFWLALGGMAAATTSAIGVYHTGVERDWWQGPTSCTGSGLDLSTLSGSDLLPSGNLDSTTLVMCDQVAWQFLSLSMASWNALWSAVFAVLWGVAMLRWIRLEQKNPNLQTF